MTHSPTSVVDEKRQPRVVRRARLAAMVGAFALMLAAAGGSVAADPQLNRRVLKGEGAEVVLVFSDPTTQGLVFVTRSTGSGSLDTVLSYQIVDRLTGHPAEEGAGIIPNSAFTTTAKSAHLLIDTGTLPDFTYSVGSGGLLDITWTENGVFEMMTNGTTVETFPGTKRTIVGQRTLVTADAVGTYFGDIVHGVLESSVDTNKGTTITIERTVP